MEDGNTAALKVHELKQERLDQQAPSKEELKNFIEDWLVAKRDEMGVEFILEALNEADSASMIMLFLDFKQCALELGYTVKAIANRYWRPMALKAAESHDFNKDRRLGSE